MNIGQKLGLVVFLVIIFIRGSLIVSDKSGFYVATNKQGRQIFIQSLSHYLGPNITATSDFDDYNIFHRFWVEPMRTTIKLKSHNSFIEWNEFSIYKFLSIPIDSILIHDEAKFSISENESIEVYYLKQILQKDSIDNMKKFLEGMGFEKIIFIFAKINI